MSSIAASGRFVAGTALREPEFAAALRTYRAAEQRADPDLPTMEPAELRAHFAADESENSEHLYEVLLDGERALAVGHLQCERDAARTEFASLEIHAGPDAAAANRAMALHLLELAEARGRTSILTWGRNTPWRDRFWTAAGATLRYTERYSSLDLTAVDAAEMDRWIAARQTRAPDIRLVRWEARCPDAHLGRYTAISNAMNDAPLEGIDVADFELTAAMMRREEVVRAKLGRHTVAMIAVDPGGKAVGKTSVLINIHRPNSSWQWDTVVLPEARRRGIGRWLKAEMWRYLREAHPEVGVLRTGNAGTNDAMWAINAAMGYQPLHTYGAWQTDLATLRAGLLAQVSASV